jgi:hypothetical protein
VVSREGLIALKRLRGSAQDLADIALLAPGGELVTRVERALRQTSDARDLCLALRRAFAGPRVLAELRAGRAATLARHDLHLALGLAWVERDLALIRGALDALPPDRIEADAVLLAFRDASHHAITPSAAGVGDGSGGRD